MSIKTKVLGLFDLFKLADRDLIEKVLKIAETIEVEDLGETVRISICLSKTQESKEDCS